MIEPYLELWAAVLEVSVNDVRVGAHSPDCRASSEWLFSDDRSPRSFLWVCDMLGADSRRVRAICYIDNSVNLSDTART